MLLPSGVRAESAEMRAISIWHERGVKRQTANVPAAERAGTVVAAGRPWTGISCHPELLCGQVVQSGKHYALAILHLGDRIRGGGAFVQQFPGGERTPTLAEVQEIQRRLTGLWL